MGRYYAKKSRENVMSHLRQMSIFCIAFNASFLPVRRNTLLGFVELMSRTVGFDHIQHILGSVRFLHKFTGHEYPGDTFEFEVLMIGLRRKLAKPAKQALPITPRNANFDVPVCRYHEPLSFSSLDLFLVCI